jgi:hypothetical protein
MTNLTTLSALTVSPPLQSQLHGLIHNSNHPQSNPQPARTNSTFPPSLSITTIHGLFITTAALPSNPFKPIPKHKPVAILTHQTVLLPLQERKKKMQIRTEVREEPD